MPPDQGERAFDLVDTRLDFGSHISSPAIEKARIRHPRLKHM
jgi:hypothetical protein